jgi:hypothetical protein
MHHRETRDEKRASFSKKRKFLLEATINEIFFSLLKNKT